MLHNIIDIDTSVDLVCEVMDCAREAHRRYANIDWDKPCEYYSLVLADLYTRWGHTVDYETKFEVRGDNGQVVGYYKPDFIVDGTIFVMASHTWVLPTETEILMEVYYV